MVREKYASLNHPSIRMKSYPLFDKLWSIHGKPQTFGLPGLPQSPWTTPNVDFYYWLENNTHVYGVEEGAPLPIKKTDLYPFLKRPFEGKLYPGPRDVRAVIKLQYHGRGNFSSDKTCDSSHYDYMNSKGKPREDHFSMPCSAFLDYFPFVEHARGPGGGYCKETKYFKGKIVGTYYRTSYRIPVC